jgi:hypothetical protein
MREITLANGEEAVIDVSAIMRQMMKTFRANKTEVGEVALSPEMWGMLAGNRRRDGKITPSNN